MSVWKRLTSRWRRVPVDDDLPPEASSLWPSAAVPAGASDAEQYLRDLIARPAGTEGAEVQRAVDALRAAGRELVAIDLVHRLVVARPDQPSLKVLCADLLLARLDDRAARPILEQLWLVREHAARSAFLLGEVHERAADREGALLWYERALGRDVAYPNARDRAQRLRAELHPIEPGAATPTLFTPDGAVARGRYRLLRELGRGGAGTVYLAEDAAVGREVALKVYHPVSGPEASAQRRRLLLEARTAASLRHPGIIRIFDLEEELGAIVMERIGGGTVAGLTRAGQGMNEARALELVRGLLGPLALVHGRGIVHRDLKPSNLMLRESGEVVISDFGVALVPGDEQGRAEQVGTYSYMAPEVRKGQTATPAADVYAVGVILSELCAGAADAGKESSRIYVRLTAADPGARPQDARAALGLFPD